MKSTLFIGILLAALASPAAFADDCYAKAVVDAYIGMGEIGNDRSAPSAALGSKDHYHVALGGPDHWVILDMGANTPIIDGPGQDLEIREGGPVNEPYETWCSDDLVNWVFLGEGLLTQTYDLSGSGISTARYVKVVDLSLETQDTNTPGADIDYVASLHLGDPVCPRVAGLSLTHTSTGTTLDWDASSGIDGYHILVSSNGPYFQSADFIGVATNTWNYAFPYVQNWYFGASSTCDTSEESPLTVLMLEAEVIQLGASTVHLGDGTFSSWTPNAGVATKTYTFQSPSLPEGDIVTLSFDADDIDFSTNQIFLNGILVGTMPTQPDRGFKAVKVNLDASQVVVGSNTLVIKANDSTGGTSGNLDDYMISNLYYSYYPN